MIRKLLLAAALLMPVASQAADTSADLSIQVTPSAGVTTPSPAVAAGFTTLALNSDFSQTQPAGWFGCLGAGPGRTWYQGREGGDYGGQVPCNSNLSTGRITLIQDATIGKQVLNLKFLPSDVVESNGSGPSRIHYTTIQTVDDITQPPPNCCQHGVTFPSNYYMESTYKIKNTPDVPFIRMSGIWWGFWQGGEGTPPGSRWPTLEVDHPEQHGEDPGELGFNVINWMVGGGQAFPPPWGPRGDTQDFTQYHTFGVRSQTSGNNITLCGYLDNAALGCNTYGLAAGQSVERKYMILFAGLQCFAAGGVVTAQCINKPVTLYQCGSEVCVQSSTDIIRRTDHNYFLHLRGVTGGSNNVNGSWPGAGIDARHWRLVGSSWAGPYSSGSLNETQGVDLSIQNVRVWSCGSWQTTNC